MGAVIFNELLFYTKHFMDSASVDNIKKIVMHFYDDTEIVDAKRAIWANNVDVLGAYPERKSTDNRHARIPNVNDIFNALSKLDAVDKMPRIAALQLNKIPDRQPEELNILSIIDRVARMENNMTKHEETLSTLAIDIMELKDNRQSYATVAQKNSTPTSAVSAPSVPKSTTNRSTNTTQSDAPCSRRHPS